MLDDRDGICLLVLGVLGVEESLLNLSVVADGSMIRGVGLSLVSDPFSYKVAVCAELEFRKLDEKFTCASKDVPADAFSPSSLESTIATVIVLNVEPWPFIAGRPCVTPDGPPVSFLRFS